MKLDTVDAASEDTRAGLPQRRSIFGLLVLFSALFAGGCDKNQPNLPPVADAGPDQHIDLGEVVQLNGTGSNDPDGDPLEYTWELTSMPSGSTCSITNPGAAMTSFEPDACTAYHVRLTVSDGKDFDTDECVITVNGPPLADAGPDQAVEVGQSVLLDGSGSSDPEGGALDFTWSFHSKPPSSQAYLSDPFSESPTFTPDMGGAYVAELVVDDGSLESEPDRVTVSANTRPIAHAGSSDTVWVESFVELDGSGSQDPDGDALSYSWSFVSKPTGSGAALSNPSSKKPGFTPDSPGEYVVSLTVSDGALTSDPDYVTITAKINRPPVAVAGSYPIYGVGDLVQLDGTGSYDPDGQTQALTYRWSFVARPSGSGAQLSNSTSPTPSFTADMSGGYVIKLIVNDGMVDSSPDQTTIMANTAPHADAGMDKTVDTGTSVTLDGSGSWDADGDPLTYSWSFESRPSGSSVQFSDASSQNPSFLPDKAGSYVIRLTVNDGIIDSAPDHVTVTAEPPGPNHPPVADAGPNQTTEVGEKVTLNGTGSYDPDPGDVLEYEWLWSKRPSGSSARLYSATSAKPYFTPDVAGSYVASLTVSDGELTDVDQVTITVASPVSLTGTWSGPDEDGFTWDLVLTEGAAGSVSGSAAVSYLGLPVFSGGSVSGDRSGYDVELTITFSGYSPAVFTGTLSSNGETMTGVLNGSGFEDYGLELHRVSGSAAPRAELRVPIEAGSKSLAEVLRNWKG